MTDPGDVDDALTRLADAAEHLQVAINNVHNAQEQVTEALHDRLYRAAMKDYPRPTRSRPADSRPAAESTDPDPET